jgi:hypothetical protein
VWDGVLSWCSIEVCTMPGRTRASISQNLLRTSDTKFDWQFVLVAHIPCGRYPACKKTMSKGLWLCLWHSIVIHYNQNNVTCSDFSLCLCLLWILITVTVKGLFYYGFWLQLTVLCIVLLIVIGIVIFCIVIRDCGFFILFCDTPTEVFSGVFPQLLGKCQGITRQRRDTALLLRSRTAG